MIPTIFFGERGAGRTIPMIVEKFREHWDGPARAVFPNIYKKEKPSLVNIKSYLKKHFKFEENLTFSCTDTTCYIFVDNKRIENFEVKNLFSSTPVVYQNNEILEFLDITIDNISYSVVFELAFDKDYKSKDILLEANTLFYFYNSIQDEVRIFETLGSYEDYYENLKIEVSDAF